MLRFVVLILLLILVLSCLIDPETFAPSLTTSSSSLLCEGVLQYNLYENFLLTVNRSSVHPHTPTPIHSFP